MFRGGDGESPFPVAERSPVLQVAGETLSALCHTIRELGRSSTEPGSLIGEPVAVL
jgi:hypothetical protein